MLDSNEFQRVKLKKKGKKLLRKRKKELLLMKRKPWGRERMEQSMRIMRLMEIRMKKSLLQRNPRMRNQKKRIKSGLI